MTQSEIKGKLDSNVGALVTVETAESEAPAKPYGILAVGELRAYMDGYFVFTGIDDWNGETGIAFAPHNVDEIATRPQTGELKIFLK